MTSRKTVSMSAALLTAFAGTTFAGSALVGPSLAGYARAMGPQDGDVIGEVSHTSLYLRSGVVDAAQPRAGLAELAGSEGRFVVQLDGPARARLPHLEAVQVLAAPGREVVDHPDPVTPGRQGSDEVGADEAGPAGDDEERHGAVRRAAGGGAGSASGPSRMARGGRRSPAGGS